ncbi:glycoside hydrolase superfamily [Kockovaella imperatae]|uniref:beta-N-acetylhexosaminidase n=1 Tax=Kockovaella imperatae TaxID=4999 RepID=A0A1Y1UPV5_9TREE|nr:glycoside hydrolase superfamily [Kockovaella imperatae]ORX39607.1 glycoside hydrolase superfamily [Kockovaella imperatae]
MSFLPSDDGAFQWRGFMLDACRHFWPMEEVRRLVDGMALLKLNVLHFHLSEDQGWRFESKKWPKLTEIGAWRDETLVGRPAKWEDGNLYPESYKDKFDGKKHGGFYTQDELKELCAYAKKKGITVVPEIDMPGHMRAARAAYPELGYDGKVLKVGKAWGVYPEVLRVDELGLKFCKDILDELCEVFDSPYIHIGGDECPKSEWEESQTAREQLKEIGGKHMDELQRHFTTQIAAYLHEKGKKMLGWDEIIDGGVPGGDPIVVAWRDWTKAAQRSTAAGVQTIQAPGLLYFDHAQGPVDKEPLSIGPGADLEAVYAFDPYKGIEEEHKDLIYGMQAQIWTEYVPTIDHLWYMVFPRLIALADVAYLGDKRPSYEEFRKGLPARLEELKALGIGSHPL